MQNKFRYYCYLQLYIDNITLLQNNILKPESVFLIMEFQH